MRYCCAVLLNLSVVALVITTPMTATETGGAVDHSGWFLQRPNAAVGPSAAGDSDNDGLPDAWERGPGRALGCDPQHADLLVYTVERTSSKAKVDAIIARATKFFDALKVDNPDGTSGIHLHVIRGQQITDTSTYQELGKTYLPANLKGRAHFHLFAQGNGGGQTSGNTSVSGADGDAWPSFVHELGHQVLLTHNGGTFKVQSPIHASLMNYAYNFSFNGSANDIQYSDGRFAALQMRETDLNETLPFPIDSLGFLAKAPYQFALKAAGSKTLVDWNRNGVFGEQHVRADINYDTGSYLGDRFNVEAAETAPVAAYRGKDFYVAYGVSPQSAGGPAGRAGRRGARGAANAARKGGAADSAPGPTNIVLRRFVGNGQWSSRIETGIAGAIGDPTFVVADGTLWVSALTSRGVTTVGLRANGSGAQPERNLAASFPALQKESTLAEIDGHLFLFLRDPESHHVTYKTYSGNGHAWSAEVDTGLLSLTSVGVAWNSVQHQAMIVVTASANSPSRVAVYSLGVKNGHIDPPGEPDWIGGAAARYNAIFRPAAVFDTTRDAGPRGRLYVYYLSGPNRPASIGMQVQDPAFHGGWLARSAYDQWSTTSSSPGAALSPDGDIAYCYREGSNGMVRCSFHGSGVEDGEMGDIDELAFIRATGLRKSLAR